MTEAQNPSEEKKANEEGCCCGEGGCGCQHGEAAPETAEAGCCCGKESCECGAEAPEAEKAPTVEELQAQLKLSEAKVLEHYDLYVRAMAEVENTRRRSTEELVKARKFAIEKFAENLLPVVDSLEKALEATKDEPASPVREGMEATYRQLIHALDVSDMKPIDPKGQAFDPHQHQAIMMVPAPEGQKAGEVVQVFQRGWSIAGRVLRPAMVSVAQ
ncbi:nucleotide exchange factor GrpE [Sutterella sp.]|uniref:nucleotide exchange factor GrpE n=1 Tax=Sutterella sp. TaxID=1981025 RepID=UPI0026DF92C7|nr:nucleotide exchange factor GrpE [Sutterella sp.]MDO5530648.1 nucleotide exchange factor GrpE [Sutterella sp.]